LEWTASFQSTTFLNESSDSESTSIWINSIIESLWHNFTLKKWSIPLKIWSSDNRVRRLWFNVNNHSIKRISPLETSVSLTKLAGNCVSYSSVTPHYCQKHHHKDPTAAEERIPKQPKQ
jgi:hypothetical protein